MFKRTLAGGLITLGATVLGLALWNGTHPERLRSGGRSPDLVELLAAPDDQGFARIAADRALRFPADHAAHPEHRTEWWYISGVLDVGNDQPAVFQLALARLGLAAEPPERPSHWATSAAYFGYLTLSDPHGGPTIGAQRTSRAALGLAGAEQDPTRIWIEDWRLQRNATDDGSTNWRLRAGIGEASLTLELTPAKPSIGMDEFAARGSEGRPPFRMYILPRMTADGTLRVGENRSRARGTVSMEHAWGELPLPGGPIARDRFAIYLKDGRELFLVRTHRVNDTDRASVAGLLVDQQGRSVVLGGDEIELDPTGHWDSERSGARYPVRWSLQIPHRGFELAIAPYAADRETIVWAPMWAGAVNLSGTSPTGPLSGQGFVQLNGYGGTGKSR